jgi:hypothetical protein
MRAESGAPISYLWLGQAGSKIWDDNTVLELNCMGEEVRIFWFSFSSRTWI